MPTTQHMCISMVTHFMLTALLAVAVVLYGKQHTARGPPTYLQRPCGSSSTHLT